MTCLFFIHVSVWQNECFSDPEWSEVKHDLWGFGSGLVDLIMDSGMQPVCVGFLTIVAMSHASKSPGFRWLRDRSSVTTKVDCPNPKFPENTKCLPNILPTMADFRRFPRKVIARFSKRGVVLVVLKSWPSSTLTGSSPPHMWGGERKSWVLSKCSWFEGFEMGHDRICSCVVVRSVLLVYLAMCAPHPLLPTTKKTTCSLSTIWKLWNALHNRNSHYTSNFCRLSFQIKCYVLSRTCKAVTNASQTRHAICVIS